MIEIDDKLVSEELLEKKFVCDLSACKGECCIAGNAGAPVDEDEVAILDDIIIDIKPYMRKQGVEAVEAQGAYVVGYNNELETPLINGVECVYVTFDAKGTALCAIEQAHKDGKVDFKKPISCHLYPIRLKEYETFTAVNYDKWDICKDACSCGSKLDVPVYKFLKEPIKRKFGNEFYKQLEATDTLLKK
jgi:hypothetical protein